MVRPSLPWFRILLVAAVIATHAHADCVANNETCCFEGEYQLSLSDTYEDYEDADPLVYTTPSWMRACLQSVMMEGAKAQATITILRNVLLETYSFSDLVRDSTDTNSSVEGYYADRFQVHSIAVPAVSLLDEVLEAASSETPDNDDRVNSYTFHYGLADVFRQLYDGHTQYSTPFVDWGLYRIVTLRPELNSDGDQVYVLKAMPGWEEGGFGSDFFTPERYESVHGVPLEAVSGHEGKRVVRVNGVEVEKYVQARADSLGEIKSASGRVNNLLNSDYEPGMQMLYGMPPPESDLETFEFHDGTSATWHLTVAYSGGATGREDLEAAYGASEAYDTFRNVFQAVVEKYEEIWEESCSNCNPYDDYGGARRSSSPSSSPGNATIASRMERWSAVLRDVAPELKRAFDSLPAEGMTAPLARQTMSDVVGRRRSLQQMDGDECDVEECEEFVDYDYADFTDEEAVEVASNVMQVQLFWAGEAKANGTAFLGVYHVEAEAEGVDDAMVLKLNTFSPEYGAWAPMQGSSAGDTMPFFKALTQAMERADSYAQENNIPNLILDMSANGGGWTAGIFYALRLVMSGWTEWSDICDAAFLKVSDLGNFFSEAGEYALLELLDDANDEEVADVGEEILDIIGTIESMGALLSNVTEELYLNSTVFDDVASLREDMQNEELPVDEKRTLMRKYLTTKVEELSHGPITLLAAQGKYSLSTEEPFQGIDWYKESRTRAFRGGATVEYTQQFIAECPAALEAFAEIHNGDAQAVAHSFEKVIVVTDGTCGSACSTFATRLMLSGGVKSVTYGGLLGVEMDSSAFGGGNVYDWITYSRESVIAYFVNLMLGHIPDPDDPVDNMDITDVPVPLPSGASVRFTVDNTLEPYLGPNSLPREFYSIPADVHLPMWAPGAGNFPIVPEGSTEAVHTNIVPVWKATLSEFSDAPVLTAWRRKDWDFASGCAANCADDSPSTTTPSPTPAPTAPSTPSSPAPPSSTPGPNPNPNPTPSPPLTPTPSPTPSPNPNPNPNPTTSPPVTPTPSPTPGTDSDDSAATPLRNSSLFALASLFLLSLSAALFHC